mgnify:CR=1 FL=1
MKTYNGHRSKNSWNVSLWLNNDYNLYKEIETSLEKNGLQKTIKMIVFKLEGDIYNKKSIKEAIEGMV